jgi:hypothetical protein
MRLTLSIPVSHHIIVVVVGKIVLTQSPIVIVITTIVIPGRIRIRHPPFQERAYILPLKAVQIYLERLAPQYIFINQLLFQSSNEYRAYCLEKCRYFDPYVSYSRR